MNHSPLYTHDIVQTLESVLDTLHIDKCFILTDEHTYSFCYPIIAQTQALKHAKRIVVKCGDEHKTLESLSFIWKSLEEAGATRHSVLINLGGGMVTDIGGFAAGTFKRGIKFINIPTTLLAMVDASLGAKTGINFYNLKNNIGMFVNPQAVIIYHTFLNTLSASELCSGYAEMIKHALLSNEQMWAETLAISLEYGAREINNELIKRNVSVKETIVNKDPYEKDLRKALNLGHTLGHAFETFMMKKRTPIPHGYAVVWGLVGEVYLSVTSQKFPSYILNQLVRFVKSYYPPLYFSCDNYEELIDLMKHDKKNKGENISFTLLKSIGKVVLDCTFSVEEIKNALDFVREG